MGVRTWLDSWPVYRQLTGGDPLGRGAAAQSPRSKALEPRTATADRVAHSVCPYCAVGCAQRVYVKDEKVVQIEGNPDSPISRGRLCPKGSAQPGAGHRPAARAEGPVPRARTPRSGPSSTSARRWRWSPTGCSTARERGWQERDDERARVRRTMGLASLGGATLDNEENYLIKKLFTAMGAIQIENQARI